MILGIGIDIIEIDRIKNSIAKYGEKFLHKIFTEKEIEYCSTKGNSVQHYAARFAAKEAISKALSTGWNNEFHWKEIEISNLTTGAPIVELLGGMKQYLTDNKQLKITMSHSDFYVTCFAIYFRDITI
jgi:holo-[acyl-carrier protein] synthase